MALEPRAVALDIGRIVIDGFAVERRARFLDVFAAECGAALAEIGFAGGLVAPDRVEIALKPDATAEDLARAVARAVARSMRNA
jgi:hypothetical protein